MASESAAPASAGAARGVVLRGLMRKEWLALRRDRLALAALFVMPLAFIVVMTLALQNVFGPPAAPAAYAWLDRDGQAGARALREDWTAQHGAARELPADWRAALQGGRLGYVLEIEPGVSERLAALEAAPAGADAPPPPRVRLWLDPALGPAPALATEAGLERSLGRLRARLVMAQLGSSLPGEVQGVDDFLVAARVSTGPRPTATQHNVPAWMVFGMFFVVAALGSLFVEERQGGALARLQNLGVGPGMLLASKGLTYVGVNVLQAMVMLMAGAWLLPALGADGLSLRGVRPEALAAVLAATSAAAVGLGLWMASLMRTHKQAQAVAPLLNVLMGALGGVMVPVSVMPAGLQSLARLSPMHWALQPWQAVLVRGASLREILPSLLPLLALALLTLGAAAWRLRRPLTA